ncbi:MAG TPA: TatD family hydrolase [Nitrososphaeraceae archaeon]|nr:TatD family hydrolase [Nitrososphaeraceae archaeon]
MLFDAHIHLTDDEFTGYIEFIVNNLRALKINACSVTVNNETSLRNLQYFNHSTKDVITKFIGIHPEFASTEDLAKFIEIFNENSSSIEGIGEIGMDPTYVKNNNNYNNINTYQKQKEVFGMMLDLAEATKKPVSIHSRRALDDILETLSSYNIEGVLLHWFAGSKKQLKKSMDMGLYVSYGPALVYSKEKKILLKNTDRDKILVETDGPVKYSSCFDNYPAMSSSFLITIVDCVAKIIGISYKEILDILRINSESYLKKAL